MKKTITLGLLIAAVFVFNLSTVLAGYHPGTCVDTRTCLKDIITNVILNHRGY